MVDGVYEPATMKISTWKKDMSITAEFADDVGCATPLFALTQPADTEAMGLGVQEIAAVFEVLKKTIVTDPKFGTRKRRSGLFKSVNLRLQWPETEDTRAFDTALHQRLLWISGDPAARGLHKFGGQVGGVIIT